MIYLAYIGEYLRFRYLKSLVILPTKVAWIFWWILLGNSPICNVHLCQVASSYPKYPEIIRNTVNRSYIVEPSKKIRPVQPTTSDSTRHQGGSIRGDVFQVMRSKHSSQRWIDTWRKLFHHPSCLVMVSTSGWDIHIKNTETNELGRESNDFVFCEIGDYLCHLVGLPQGPTSYIHMCQGGQ